MAIFQFRNRFDTALAGNLFQHRKITQGEEYLIRGRRAGFRSILNNSYDFTLTQNDSVYIIRLAGMNMGESK